MEYNFINVPWDSLFLILKRNGESILVKIPFKASIHNLNNCYSLPEETTNLLSGQLFLCCDSIRLLQLYPLQYPAVNQDSCC